MAETAAAFATGGADARTTAPPVWFVLPPGFTVLDTSLTRERLQATAEGLVGDGVDAAARVATAVDALVAQFEGYRAAGITFAASGAHPAAGGGLDLSTLTAATLPVDVDHDTFVASLVMAESEQEGTTTVGERRLPAGPAVVSERHQVATAGGPTGGPDIRVIRATVPTPHRTHVVVLELATAAVHAWDAYRDVFVDLLLPSVTFADPVAALRRDQASRARASHLHTRLG